MNFEQFKEQSLAQGYDEVKVSEWAPEAKTEIHTHAFGASVRVARGEFWLTVGENTRHMQAGEDFTIEPQVEHSERYGAEGVTFWVARKN